MILRVGDMGVDFSFARPPAQRLLDLNYSFIVGYISVYPSAPAKNITHAELDAYEAAGIDTLLVWEMSATRANLGAKYGTQDGANASIEAQNRDYPSWKPILAADDTNTTATNIDAQEAYMRAFAKACSPYPIGIYGDTDILERCKDLWVLGWLPNAWSWSGTSRVDAEAKARALGVQVLQRKGFYIDGTWAVDPNEVIRDVAFGPPDPPPPQGDDMEAITFEVIDLPGIYLWAPGMPAPVPFDVPASFTTIAPAMGAVPCTAKLSQEMYRRLFVVPPIDADELAAKVAAAIKIPPLTGHIAADLGAEGHITGSVG